MHFIHSQGAYIGLARIVAAGCTLLLPQMVMTFSHRPQ